MMQFQIALTMISKAKTSHTSELQKGFKDSGLQLYYKETASQLISCNECKILKNTYFETYLRLAASENLPVTAILIFRRNFWSSILLVFHKKHTSWSLFSIKLLIFSLKFLNEFWMNFEYFWLNFAVFILRNHFKGTSLGDCFWYLENFPFKFLTLNKFVHLINIVGRLHFVSRNVDFVKT